LTGQDGRIYLRGIAEAGTLTARWGDAPDQQCTIKYQLPAKRKDDGPFVRIDSRCEPFTSSTAGQ
jgi:outer membrane usher protein